MVFPSKSFSKNEGRMPVFSGNTQMDEKKRVKVTPMRTDSTGTGYYRAEDGTYLYGNPKNGYMKLTLEEQKKRRLKAEVQEEAEGRRQKKQMELDALHRMRAEHRSDDDTLAGILAGTLVGVIFVTMLYVFLLCGLAYSLTVLWPTYIKDTLLGFVDIFKFFSLKHLLFVLLYAAHIAAIWGLLASRIKEISPADLPGKCAADYAKRAGVVSLVIFVLIGILQNTTYYPSLGESFFNCLSSGINGILYVILPTLIVYYWAFHRSGEKGFLKYLAGSVCSRVPSKLIIALGVLALPISFIMKGDPSFYAFIFGGIFSIIFGILGR